jgi:hypothetical protein
VAAARRCIQAVRLLLEEEETNVAVVEQSATVARQRLQSSSSAAPPASQVVTATSSSYEDTVITGFHLQAAAVLNVRQLVNIVLDSSTNYASCVTLWSRPSSATPSSSTSRPTPRPMIRGGFGWTVSSSTGSAIPSHQSFNKWSGNAAVQRATPGSPSRTSFSATVSNIPFTLTLPFVTLFRTTSRCLSTVASSRPWSTVLPT